MESFSYDSIDYDTITQFIKENPDYPWVWDDILWNPNITQDIINLINSKIK